MRDFLIFTRHLLKLLHFLRGIFLAQLMMLLAFALLTALFDGIALSQAIYFVFITALTIGFGDITPASGFTQFISVLSGFVGVIFVGLLSAISVRALQNAVQEASAAKEPKSPDDKGR